jgi:hypothetical protein
MLQWRIGFWFWYKKAVMPKKKVIAARNLKRLDQVYHSKQEKQKRKSEFFYRDNFVLASEMSLHEHLCHFNRIFFLMAQQHHALRAQICCRQSVTRFFFIVFLLLPSGCRE